MNRWSTLVATAILLAFSAWASAATWYVRAAGNDQADGTTAATAFKSVLRAAQVVNHGDTIVIGPGTHRAALLIAERFGTTQQPLAITGDESGQLTGDAAGPVVIEPSDPSAPAIAIYRGRNVVVTGLTFQSTSGGGGGQGLELRNCRDVVVQRCTFDNLSRGFIADRVTGLRVEASVFTRNVIGLFVKNSHEAQLAHLTVAASTSAGALLLGNGQGRIFNSIFAANNINFSADAVSAAAWTSDHNAISGTTGPWGDGMAIQNIYEWTASSGQDRNSVYVTPAFVDPEKFDLHIDPAVSWGGGLPGYEVGDPPIPRVLLDRDGNKFHVGDWMNKSHTMVDNEGKTTLFTPVNVGAYAYPEPQPANGWKKISAPMPQGIRQSAAIYGADGQLIRMLLADANGVRELWWDGLDDQGTPVPAGNYEVRAVGHDVRLLDDGNIGDNGNPLGTYNPDQADRVVVLPDGSFFVTAVYDEAGFALRRYSSSGQPTFASGLTESAFFGIALHGDELVGGVMAAAPGVNNGQPIPKIVRLVMPGERAPFADGREYYPVLADGEAGTPMGLAVIEGKAYVSLGGLNVVRVIDLTNGAKVSDIPLDAPADLATDGQGQLWAIGGTDVICLTAGAPKKFATGLAKPAYLAVGHGRIAVVDRDNEKLAILDAGNGNILKTYGTDRGPEVRWDAASTNLWRNPRGCAFLPDGQLLVTEQSRIRAFWPDSGAAGFELISNFMESAVVHPTVPRYVYAGLGIYEVDPDTGSMRYLAETPSMYEYVNKENPGKSFGSPGMAVVLDGRPFIASFNSGTFVIADVSDPVKPREALRVTDKDGLFNAWSYATVAFTKGGDILSGGHYALDFTIYPYKGLDGSGNPTFDFANPRKVGPGDAANPAGTKAIASLAGDMATGDIYYLAVSEFYKKMVPGWGADGTGVGRSSPDGKPLWFARSSGGNYMSISAVNDGKNAWVMAGKSFGGQVDVFDADGLRLTTGNWGWNTNYAIGFVDLRYGVHAYMRPDGKPGAYIEDDAIGRFARYRLEGAESVKREKHAIQWDGNGAAPMPPGIGPMAEVTAGRNIPKLATIPHVAPGTLPIDGDWAKWVAAGISPQIVALPNSVGFKRTMPDDLMQTFKDATQITALAHDGANFYAYTVVADSTPVHEAVNPGDLWKSDGLEFWIEEEQFLLGLKADGQAALFKSRFHDRAGKEWAAGYELPRENVWGMKLDNLAAHPLGRLLGSITAANVEGKTGYALAVKIPFEEVKLVGGIAAREGITDMTGRTGEVVRIAVSLNAVYARGRTQDSMIDWPCGKMFSDPTRSYPFALGE